MKKYKKTKPGDWSPRYLGYKGYIDHEEFYIIAQNEGALRMFHRKIFPDLPFRPKFIHPCSLRRIGD